MTNSLNRKSLKEEVILTSLVPDPHRVGHFVKPDSNDTTRYLFPNTWVFHDDVVENVLSGSYDKITPFCAEIVPTMNCTNRCTQCAYKFVKILNGTWRKNDFDDTQMHMQDVGLAKSLSDKLIDGGVKGFILTGGGEPSCFLGLEELMHHLNIKGVDQVLYTNGNNFTPERIQRVVEAQPLLVRVSLNCGSKDVYNKFHNPLDRRNAFSQALTTIESLAYGALENPRMSVGVGVVVNKINQKDLVEAAKRIREIKEKVGGGIEFITYRPEFNYYSSEQLRSQLLDETCAIVDTEVRQALDGTGIRLANVKPRFQALKYNTKSYAECRGTGIFGEVRPDGKMYFCCDRNLNPNYYIGDLTQNSLHDIYFGSLRQEILSKVNSGKLVKCPPACKSHELNKQFEDVERFRAAGELGRVKIWIEMQQEMKKPKMINF